MREFSFKFFGPPDFLIYGLIVRLFYVYSVLNRNVMVNFCPLSAR